MVSSVILEHVILVEVRKNYTNVSDIEVNPERRKFDFTKRLSID